jgi:hypothetical protein
LNENGETQRWFDIHPVIHGIDEFQKGWEQDE